MLGYLVLSQALGSATMASTSGSMPVMIALRSTSDIPSCLFLTTNAASLKSLSDLFDSCNFFLLLDFMPWNSGLVLYTLEYLVSRSLNSSGFNASVVCARRAFLLPIFHSATVILYPRAAATLATHATCLLKSNAWSLFFLNSFSASSSRLSGSSLNGYT